MLFQQNKHETPVLTIMKSFDLLRQQEQTVVKEIKFYRGCCRTLVLRPTCTRVRPTTPQHVF